MKKNLSTLSLLVSLLSFSQNLPKDTIYGKVKSIKEKMIYLKEKKEEHIESNTMDEIDSLIEDNDYGEFGIMNPDWTRSELKNIWFSSEFTKFINYEKSIDSLGNTLSEIWYDKKNNFVKSFKYLYDKKNRKISSVDSTKYGNYTVNHYFEDFNDIVFENIISEDIEDNSFYHTFKQYKNKKLVRTKMFDEYGVVKEFVHHYNLKGNLEFVIYKNPNSWKKIDDISWSYGVHDTIIKSYKAKKFLYNKNDKLIAVKEYGLKDYTDSIELIKTTNYQYEAGNLIYRDENNFSNYKSYFYYKYDKNNRLIGKYCCDKDIKKSKLIRKYKYKNGKIDKLKYMEDVTTSKMKIYNVSFLYKFDSNNNWIEIIKIVNGEKLYKWIREIEYY